MILSGGIGGRGGLRGRWIGVDDLSRTGVAKLLAGFTLNRLGIGFQALDFFLQALVFALQRIDLGVERAAVLLLLVIRQHPVGAKKNMPSQHAGQNRYPYGGQAAAPWIEALVQRINNARQTS